MLQTLTWTPSYRASVYAHELAHAMGLGHAATTPQVMYPVVGAQAWGAGDIAGFASFPGYQSCGA